MFDQSLQCLACHANSSELNRTKTATLRCFYSKVTFKRETYYQKLRLIFQWHLLCDRRHLKAMTQAVYMAGLLVGAIAFSSISDHFRRKISFFMSIGFLVNILFLYSNT